MNPSRKWLAAAVLALLAAGIAQWLASRPPTASGGADDASHTNPPSLAVTTRPPPQFLAAEAGQRVPQLCPHARGSAEHRAWLQRRGEALMDLSWNDDRESLEGILVELSNPDAELRKSALLATLNHGSRDAVPRLQAVALATDDPAEKKALEDAAEHLKLPSLTEVLAERRKAAAAGGK